MYIIIFLRKNKRRVVIMSFQDIMIAFDLSLSSLYIKNDVLYVWSSTSYSLCVTYAYLQYR